MVNYVEQQDVHMPLLTVRETFQFALDNAVPDPSLLNDPKIIEMHKHKVDAVIELLGLKECENTIVGNAMNRGVSGGQKKRVTLVRSKSFHSLTAIAAATAPANSAMYIRCIGMH